ncbi:jg8171 [Pararge aegeria aegeria]|uniref:Jg8171 protein n=1 Tax=Pararge aegeria aegeria TaxID=348720 RepID=A0A8S4SLL3_9NEOP|nr:jg8171 [Pararge aegeria aegeria]
MDRYRYLRKAKEPRKILKVKSSKYESSEMIHNNKKYWETIFNNMSAPAEGPLEEKEINLLSEVLPNDLCDKVCNILHIGVISKELKETDNVEVRKPRRLVKEPLLSYRKTLHINRELDSDTDVEFISSDEDEKPSIHKEFLKKPEREQITWNTRYLEPEREDEKTLVKRANDLTDKIAHNFCDYMKQLGGDQQSQLFTPKAIKELFQIEFDTHVARSLQVVPKEMPTVKEHIATITENTKMSEFAALGREITKDMKAECRGDHYQAFHRSLPKKEQWRAPRNDTKNMWRSARHVPRELVTLKTVWDGITNLRSVKEYCRWMIEHPEYRRAPYLRSLGMFDSTALDARLTFELQQQMSPPILSPTDIPAPIDHIRRRLSELAETTITS